MRVFISSTSDDLKNFRAAARDVILGLGWYPVMMEYFGTSSEDIIQSCYQHLGEADLMLLLLAHRRGWVPNRRQGGDGKKSIVELEIEQARLLGVPIILLLADEDWPGQLWENNDVNRRAVKRLREDINLPALFFSYERMQMGGVEVLPQFQGKVRQELLRHKLKQIADKLDSGGTLGEDGSVPNILAAVGVSEGKGLVLKRGLGPAKSVVFSVGMALMVAVLLFQGNAYLSQDDPQPRANVPRGVPGKNLPPPPLTTGGCIEEFGQYEESTHREIFRRCACVRECEKIMSDNKLPQKVHNRRMSECVQRKIQEWDGPI